MTYEYACPACGHAWEAEQSISAPALTECPSCKQATAKRQVSGGAGFILKGGGWYADLYSSSSAKKPAEGSESAASESKSADGKSADGKSADSKSADGKSADKPKTDTAAPATSTSSNTSTGTSPKGSSSTGAASS